MTKLDETVAVVVITYNRLKFLQEIVESLRNQTRKPDKIFVINNSSTDGTEEWLAGQQDLTVLTQDNVGSSGGQYTGIKSAYESNCDWIWTMDDDVIPDNNCLELLLENTDKSTIRTPLRYTPEGTPFLNDAIDYNLKNPFKSIWNDILSEKDLNNLQIKATGITFEGPLFHRTVVEKIGLPEKKFFIYGDDTEYFIRAVKAGFAIVIIRNAKFQRKLPAPVTVKHLQWKLYYVVRNIIAIDVLHGNLPVRLIRPFAYLIRWVFRCNNMKDISTVIKAFFNGYFYKSANEKF